MTKKQLEQLLEHGPFLRRLARKLLRDASRADDVVQEAWLVALRSDKSPSEVQRGWLAGIVRNLVRRSRRDEQRRTRRERVAARTLSVRSTGEMFDDELARRHLAGLVLALPEHYKTAILMRYYHGLAPQTIAERLGVTPSTVRSRLQRGLERIRRELEVEHAGNTRAIGWMLAAIVTGTVPRAAGAVLTRATAAAVLIGAVWLALAPSSDEPAPRAERAGLYVAQQAPAADAPDAIAAVRAPGVRAPGTPENARVLAGRVILPSGVESTAVQIEISALGRAGVVRTVADGTFQVSVDPLFADGPPAGLHVRATHPETDPCVVLVSVPWDDVVLRLQRRPLVPEEELTPARLQPDADPTQTLASPAEATAIGGAVASDATAPQEAAHVLLRGVVHIPDGVTPDTALVEASRGRQSVALRVRPDREFALDVGALLDGELPGTLQLTVSHPDTLPQRLDLPVFAGPRLDFVEVWLDPAATLRGVVTLEDGSPADGATVAAYPLLSGIPGEALVAATLTDSTGRFELPVPPDSDYYVAAAAQGWAPAGATAVREMELVLTRGASIEGNVTGPTGPVADAQVDAVRPGDTNRIYLASQALAWTPGGLAWATTVATSDAEGHYRIGGLEAEAEYEVALGDESRLVVAPGEADFSLERVRLTITVLGAGLPVAGATVIVDGDIATSDATGRAAVDVAPADSYQVNVSADGYFNEGRSITGRAATFDLRPDSPRATLVVSIRPADAVALPATCAFRLAPTDPSRAPIEKTVGLTAGRFVLYDLEPGTYTMVAECGGYFLRAVTAVALRGGEASLLTLEPRVGGRVVVHGTGPDGEAVDVRVLFDLDAGLLADEPAADEVGALVQAGSKQIWIEAPGYERQLLDVVITAGETTHVDAQLERVPD